jgi:uncharacterized protein YecE (DUF72 family)
MANIYAGTSGWAYTTWKPEFYPANIASKNFLSYYATQLNSVEVNYTFRRLAGEALLRRWIDATGVDFRFAVKARQTIMHIRRLRDTAEITREFLESLEPLRRSQKLGPVLFQLPPNFKCDTARLREFLADLPKGLRAAFEFRHDSWFNEYVYAVLRNAGVALCWAESEKIESPEVQTADFHYLRLRKPSDHAKDVVKAAERRVRRLARDGEVYVYFKHEEDPQGALNAAALLKRLK